MFREILRISDESYYVKNRARCVVSARLRSLRKSEAIIYINVRALARAPRRENATGRLGCDDKSLATYCDMCV